METVEELKQIKDNIKSSLTRLYDEVDYLLYKVDHKQETIADLNNDIAALENQLEEAEESKEEAEGVYDALAFLLRELGFDTTMLYRAEHDTVILPLDSPEVIMNFRSQLDRMIKR